MILDRIRSSDPSRATVCSRAFLYPKLMEPRLIWINLLVKLGVAAAVSSSLVRSKEFKSLLFREERTFRQKIYLVSVDGVAHHGRRLDTVYRKEFPGRGFEF